MHYRNTLLAFVIRILVGRLSIPKLTWQLPNNLKSFTGRELEKILANKVSDDLQNQDSLVGNKKPSVTIGGLGRDKTKK